MRPTPHRSNEFALPEVGSAPPPAPHAPSTDTPVGEAGGMPGRLPFADRPIGGGLEHDDDRRPPARPREWVMARDARRRPGEDHTFLEHLSTLDATLTGLAPSVTREWAIARGIISPAAWRLSVLYPLAGRGGTLVLAIDTPADQPQWRVTLGPEPARDVRLRWRDAAPQIAALQAYCADTLGAPWHPPVTPRPLPRPTED